MLRDSIHGSMEFHATRLNRGSIVETKAHLQAIKEKFKTASAMDTAEYCLKYLAGTANLCIHYGRTKDGKIEGRELNRLWGWVDADFAADLDTSRSHTGYVIMMNGGPPVSNSALAKSGKISLLLSPSSTSACKPNGPPRSRDGPHDEMGRRLKARCQYPLWKSQ
jgi:hypothetical protein